MATTKTARINPAGRIIPSDRQIHVSQDDGDGAADQVEFRYVGTARIACTIDFSPYLSGTPFDGPDALTFPVPADGTVRQVSKTKTPGRYKYDVVETANPKNVTDDPDVIIE